MHDLVPGRTQVGRQAGGIVAQGGLVPDDLMLEVVTGKLDALHDRVRSTEPLSSQSSLTDFLALDLGWFPPYFGTR